MALHPKEIVLTKFAKSGYQSSQKTIKRPSGFTTLTTLSPSSSKGIVLFAHGTGNDPFYPYYPLLRAVLEKNHTLLCLDIDGHGYGSSATFDPETIHSLLPSCVLLGQPISFLGHSLGAALMLHYLLKHKENHVERAFLISTPFSQIDLPMNIASEILFSLRPTSLRPAIDYNITHFLPAFASYHRRYFPIRLAAPGNYVQQIRSFLQNLNLLTDPAAINLPITLAHGRFDFIARLKDAKIFASEQTNCEVVELPFCNHYTSIWSNLLLNKVKQWLP